MLGNTPLPTTETQARELTRVPQALRPEVLRLAAQIANGGELTAKLIRLAASELGVDGGIRLVPRNGDDRVQTPDPLARAVVEHFLPCGRVVEPSSGNGAFLRVLPGADWYEIDKGKDFLKAEGRWDWAVGNPPFSQFRAFLQKAMQVADNVVFIALAPAWFVRARQEDMRQARFALVELCALPIPPTWPQFGIELTAGWARRGWQGSIAHTRLLEEPSGR